MKISELMRRGEICRDTVRYYERIGLISKPLRLPNGYRDYPESTLNEIKFIRLAQSVGFTLNQIKPAIPYLANPQPNCPILGEALKKQIELVDTKIAELSDARKRLVRWLENNQKVQK